jgi:hypothetical protein
MAEKAIQEMNRASEVRTALLQSQEQLLKIFNKHVPAANVSNSVQTASYLP